MLIKKLRRKFVAVTMILVSVTVGISFAVDEYWTRLFEEEKKTALMEFWGGNDCPDYIDKKELLDMFYENYDDYKPLTDILVIACEFLVLLLISLFLSRFVTEPAEKALEREKQFISDASHELKTPLAAISINAQALQAEIGNDRHIRHILSEARRMDVLVQKLLKLSYIEEVGKRIEMEKFSLSKAAEEMVLTFESNVFERKINFEYEIEDGIFYCGNEDEIKQVIMILLDNAMKHSDEAGRIFFQLRRSGKSIVATVENSGTAISPDDLPHIFERFYRADKSRASDENSYGLGLAIAKAVLDSHNAKITTERKEGEVTRFMVEF